MNKYRHQLSGLSLPLNVFAVVLHALAALTLIVSQLNCCAPIRGWMVWSALPTLVITLGMVIVLRGYYLLVQHTRLVSGFAILILALMHATSLPDFTRFLNYATGAAVPNNPAAALHGSSWLAIALTCIEFTAAIGLLIGSWLRIFASLIILIFGWYAFIFFYGATAEPSTMQWTFGLDPYLLNQLNVNTAFVFSVFMVIIALVTVIFGGKIHPNSVKLNWGLIPVLTLLSAGLAILLHWYALIFIVPIAISLALLIYRSGGRFLGNHYGSTLISIVFILCLIFFQHHLGIDRSQHTNKPTKQRVQENRP